MLGSHAFKQNMVCLLSCVVVWYCVLYDLLRVCCLQFRLYWIQVGVYCVIALTERLLFILLGVAAVGVYVVCACV